MTREHAMTRPTPTPTRQSGIAAVEFALVAMIFFTVFFGVVEVLRAMYVCNILQEVTRRATALAATSDFSDAAVMQRVREQAVFRSTPGMLMFADPVTDAHVKIDYLRIPVSTNPVSMSGTLPSSPQQNLVNCTSNPSADNCIGLVRVRICLPGGASGVCEPVPYQPLTSLIPFTFPLPTATTIARIESLGMAPGMPIGAGI